MSEEHRPLMHSPSRPCPPHRKTSTCVDHGCVPIIPASDDAQDAARGRWLIRQFRRDDACPIVWFLFKVFPGTWQTVEAAIDRAMENETV